MVLNTIDNPTDKTKCVIRTNNTSTDSNLTKNHHDFRLLESKNYTLGGTHAHQIVFTASDSHKVHGKAMQIWTVNNSKAYLITYKADPELYSAYFPVIQKMVDSFRFTAN